MMKRNLQWSPHRYEFVKCISYSEWLKQDDALPQFFLDFIWEYAIRMDWNWMEHINSEPKYRKEKHRSFVRGYKKGWSRNVNKEN